MFVLLATEQSFALLAFILQMIPKYGNYYRSLDDTVNMSPEATANIFSRLVFHWMDPLMKLGYSKDLTMDDLYDLKKTDTAAFNSETFQRYWYSIFNTKVH